MPTFPNVPNVPGVPALLRNPLAAAQGIVQLLTGDLVTGYGLGLGPVWGIFSSQGQAMVVADTVFAIDFTREWAIATYPVEQGGFQSYDKVNTPFRVVLTFVSGGSESNRQALLDSIDAISGDLNFYTVVTPEKVYPSVNVQRVGYRRSSGRGAGTIQVDVALLEVRVSANESSGQNTQSASGAVPNQDGTVQPWADVSPTQQSLDGVASGQGQFSTTSPTGFNPAPVTSPGVNFLPVT